MKYRTLIALLLICVFSSCEKDHRLNKEQLKKALFTCLNNADLKGRMYSDSLTNEKKRLYLQGNVLINDSIQVDKRIYIFEAKGYIHKDSICQFKLIYKSKDVANLYLLYRIGSASKVYSDCDYKYMNGEWPLVHRTNGVIDGNFK